MDLVGPYREIENCNQYALTVICILTKYVYMISLRSQSTEDIIKAYRTGVYITFRGSKYILSDGGSEFTSKQFDFLAKKLYHNLYIPLHPYMKVNHRTYTFLPRSTYQKAHMQSSSRLG